mmetsp:Transcript_158900/g.509653  ORF Transcript_158900/g.509653 Transcript_158900/m.509653 type:complete len:432 (+) Transcript_158900:203-1498(+)
MQGVPLWTCQFPGCRSSPDQLAALRTRKPKGFPHDEDPQLRVCTVCRRLPLSGGGAAMASEEVEPLDAAFLAGIREELGSVEDSEKNIQALSQVLRYYARHARQLSQVLLDWARQCFPWELIHAMHLIDDLLLMDNTGRYKAELADRVHGVAVNAFKKVPSDREKREVARMLHAWQELRIFDAALLEAIRLAIRGGGVAAARILDEVAAADEEDDEDSGSQEPAPRRTAVGGNLPGNPVKKQRLDGHGDLALDANGSGQVAAGLSAAAVAQAACNLATVERILALPVERPFEMLGLPQQGAQGHDIRKAYRRLALLIHPDKNPGLESRCQEALIRLQAGREQAEADLQRMDSGPIDAPRGETRSAATAAAASASVDSGFKCKYPGCDLPPCKQCANQCCTRNITHCHMSARLNKGMQCFFHPPPRAWARNA